MMQVATRSPRPHWGYMPIWLLLATMLVLARSEVLPRLADFSVVSFDSPLYHSRGLMLCVQFICELTAPEFLAACLAILAISRSESYYRADLAMQATPEGNHIYVRRAVSGATILVLSFVLASVFVCIVRPETVVSLHPRYNGISITAVHYAHVKLAGFHGLNVFAETTGVFYLGMVFAAMTAVNVIFIRQFAWWGLLGALMFNSLFRNWQYFAVDYWRRDPYGYAGSFHFLQTDAILWGMLLERCLCVFLLFLVLRAKSPLAVRFR